LQYRKFVDGSILRVLRRPPLRASRARAFSRVDGFELLSFLSEGSSGTKKYSSGPGLLQHQKQMQVLVPPPMAVVGPWGVVGGQAVGGVASVVVLLLLRALFRLVVGIGL